MGALRRYAPWMLFPLAVMIGGYALGEAMADRNNQWVKNQQKVNPYLVKSKKIDLILISFDKNQSISFVKYLCLQKDGKNER